MLQNLFTGKTVLFQGDSITDCGRDRISDDLGAVSYTHLDVYKRQRIYILSVFRQKYTKIKPGFIQPTVY